MRKTAITNLILNRSKPLRNRGIKVSAQSLRKFFLNAWTSAGLDKYGKLYAGKSLGRNDGAYIAKENGELEKMYMENYYQVLAIDDNGDIQTKEELQKTRNELDDLKGKLAVFERKPQVDQEELNGLTQELEAYKNRLDVIEEWRNLLLKNLVSNTTIREKEEKNVKPVSPTEAIN